MKLSLNEYFSDILRNSVESLTNKTDYVKDRVSCLEAKVKEVEHSIKDNDKFKNILMNGT